VDSLPETHKAQFGAVSFGLTQRIIETTKGHYCRCEPSRKSHYEQLHRDQIKEIYSLYKETEEPGLVCAYRVSEEFCQSAVLQGPIDETKYKEKLSANHNAEEFMQLYGLDRGIS